MNEALYPWVTIDIHGHQYHRQVTGQALYIGPTVAIYSGSMAPMMVPAVVLRNDKERMIEVIPLVEQYRWTEVKLIEPSQKNDATQTITTMGQEINDLRARLAEVNSWIVCACIASPEDMMQSAERIEQVTDVTRPYCKEGGAQ